jgi:hypothetical protein
MPVVRAPLVAPVAFIQKAAPPAAEPEELVDPLSTPELFRPGKK